MYTDPRNKFGIEEAVTVIVDNFNSKDWPICCLLLPFLIIWFLCWCTLIAVVISTAAFKWRYYVELHKESNSVTSGSNWWMNKYFRSGTKDDCSWCSSLNVARRGIKQIIIAKYILRCGFKVTNDLKMSLARKE